MVRAMRMARVSSIPQLNAGGFIVTPKSRWLSSGRLLIVTPKSLDVRTTVKDLLRIVCITPQKE